MTTFLLQLQQTKKIQNIKRGHLTVSLFLKEGNSMKLISEYGNEVVITDDEIKISRLKDMGFKEAKPLKKGTKKNGNKEDTERNI